MGRIVSNFFTSLDGVMEAPDSVGFASYINNLPKYVVRHRPFEGGAEPDRCPTTVLQRPVAVPEYHQNGMCNSRCHIPILGTSGTATRRFTSTSWPGSGSEGGCDDVVDQECEVKKWRNEALEAEGLADGLRLVCQSLPASEKLRITYSG